MDIFRRCSIFWSRVKGIWNYFGKKEQRLQEFAIGMSSEVDFKRDLHCIFLDYDDVSLERVEVSIKELQEFWGLSDCFVYRTKHGFHGIFYYDQVPYSRVRLILDFARDVDEQFKYISKFYNRKTLRTSGKYRKLDIVFVKMISGKRVPTLEESELGEMKRKERELLSKSGSIFKKELLKE